MACTKFSDVGQVSQSLEPPATDLPKVILAVAQQDIYDNNIPSLKACISFSALEGINRSSGCYYHSYLAELHLRQILEVALLQEYYFKISVI